MSDATTFADEDGEENTLDPTFATMTMGHVLRAQGREDAARQVFAAVLAREPGNADAREALGLEPVAEPDASSMTPLEVTPVAADAIRVRWNLDGVALDGAGALVLVLVSLRVAGGQLRRTEDLHPLPGTAGSVLVTHLPPGASHHVALGLADGARFTPKVTAGPVACRADD